MANSDTLVLVVEDDAMLALDLETILREAGYAICAVASENGTAEQAIATSPPAVALLDYNLGGTTSAATAIELRRRDIPFAYVTGRPEAVRADATAPSARIVAKPYSRSQILDALNCLIVAGAESAAN